MSRYIDADKLWSDRPIITEGKSQDYGAGFSECMWGFSKRIREQIDHHTADVVEVVRCKDCKHAKINENHPNKPLICCMTKMVGSTDPNWYCADGERKNDA